MINNHNSYELNKHGGLDQLHQNVLITGT